MRHSSDTTGTAAQVRIRRGIPAVVLAGFVAAACTAGDSNSTDAESSNAATATEFMASSEPTTTSTPDAEPATTISPVESTDGSAPSMAEAAASSDDIVELDCAAQLPGYVEDRIPGGVDSPRLSCWSFPTLENPDDLSSRPISITFYIWASDTDQRPADPIVYVPGGPRGSAFNSLLAFTRNDIQGDRDLVLVDTRGNSPIPGNELGLVESGCPELYDTAAEIFGASRPLSEEYELLLDGWERCLDRLRSDGWDLDQYNTPRVVGDLERLRMLLGLDQWNLYGESYSTRYALHYLKTAPGAIRAVVLDSVTPPDAAAWSPAGAAAAVDEIFRFAVDGCAASDDCSSLVPDVDAAFGEALSLLDAEPLEVEVTHPLTGEAVDFVLDGGDAAFGIGELLGPDQFTSLPVIIQAVADGNTGLLGSQASSLFGIADGGLGLSVATVCHDFGADPERAMSSIDSVLAASPPWQQLGYLSNMPCEVAGVAPAPPDFGVPVASDVPALVVIGGLDDATPPADSERAAATLTSSFIVRFDNEGHVPVRTNQCARRVVVDFWDAPGGPDLSCVDDANDRPISFDR